MAAKYVLVTGGAGYIGSNATGCGRLADSLSAWLATML